MEYQQAQEQFYMDLRKHDHIPLEVFAMQCKQTARINNPNRDKLPYLNKQSSRFLQREFEKVMPMGANSRPSNSNTLVNRNKSLHKRNSSMKSKTIYDNPMLVKPPSLDTEKQSISVPR